MENCIFLSKDYKYRVEEYNYTVYVKIEPKCNLTATMPVYDAIFVEKEG